MELSSAMLMYIITIRMTDLGKLKNAQATEARRQIPDTVSYIRRSSSEGRHTAELRTPGYSSLHLLHMLKQQQIKSDSLFSIRVLIFDKQ